MSEKEPNTEKAVTAGTTATTETPVTTETPAVRPSIGQIFISKDQDRGTKQ